MTKYSTPSIEVISFSSCDAPRIGMQWWLQTDATATAFTALGQNWTPPSGNPLRPKVQNHYHPYFDALTNNYACDDENIPGGYQYDGGNPYFTNFIVDDMKSC